MRMKQILLYLLILFFTGLVCLPVQAQTSCAPTQGLVAYYPFEEGQGSTAQDVSGQLGAGIVSSGARWQPTGGHDGNGAIALNDGEHVNIPLTWEPRSFSISFWILPTKRFNWSQGTGAGWGSFYFHSTSTGAIYVGTDVGSRMHFSADNRVELGIWQHFVYTFDNGVAAFYKNGRLLAKRAGMAPPKPWQRMYLGASGDGLYDDVRIYARAVTDQEAGDLYKCSYTSPATVSPTCAPVISVTPATALTTVGTPKTLHATTNVAGSALAFDGVDDHLSIIDATVSSPVVANVTNNFTVEAWVWPKATHEIDDPSSRYGGTSGQQYVMFPTPGNVFDNYAGTDVGMGISVGTNGVSLYEYTYNYMPVVLVYEQPLSGWTHVAVVYENRTPTLYINGRLVLKGRPSSYSFVHPPVEIGGGEYGYFQGSLDELRIWNRVRDATEINTSFASSVSSASSSLIGYWRFDEASGEVTTDVSPVRNSNLLLEGATWQTTSLAPVASSDIRWTPAINLNASTGPDVVARPAKTTTYTVTAAGPDGCATAQATATLTVTGAADLPPNNPSENRERNWTLERSFDGDGNEVAASKQFVDGLGRATQAQARNAATQQVFATQTVYNSGGQPVLQTLAAPTNNQSFNYKEGFITAGAKEYSFDKFEGNKAYDPTPVDALNKGTLGYYFSKLNAQEPLTPITSYPFSLVEPYDGPLGGTRRAAGPGDELRMGKGREAKGRDFPLRKEFDSYITLRPQFVPGSPLPTLQYQGMKSVSINADGRESIVVTNKEGQAIISCLSGAQYPGLPVFGFISAEATNRFDADAPAYQDIHIPAAGPQDVKFTMGSEYVNGGRVLIVNLLTQDTTSYAVKPASAGVEPEKHVKLDPGFYRFVSVTGTQWSSYEAHYGNFSYTYYDDAGRVVATVAPNGLPGGNLLRNPGFEQDLPGYSLMSAWDSGSKNGAYIERGSNFAPHGGQVYGVHWNSQGHDIYTRQTVAGLPSGLYTARAWVKNTGVQVGTFRVQAGTQREVSIPVTGLWGAWQLVELRDILVQNGVCTVGFYSASPGNDWIIFDDAELVHQGDGNTPTFVTRNTYDTSGRLLATESNDEGRSEYVYAQDGRIRFSQSALQRGTGRFSYSNYDEVGRVVESGEYTPDASGVEFESYSDKLAGPQMLEAEQALIVNSNPNGLGQPQAVASASGGADAGWLTNPGNYVQFHVTALLTGNYELEFRYATGATVGQTMSLLVNGRWVKQLAFAGTNGWNTFATSRHVVALTAGTNTVQVLYGSGDNGYVDLDYLRVIPPTSGTFKQEAEAASFVNSNNNQLGYVGSASGGQNVNWLTSPGNYVRFALTAPRSGTYTLRLRYATGGNGARTMSWQVNEAPAQQLTLPGTNNWDQFTTYSTSATLRAGINMVQVRYGPADNGYVDIDYLEAESGQFSGLTHPLSVHDIVENRNLEGGLSGGQRTQRNQVWYDLPWDTTADPTHRDKPLADLNRTQEFVLGAVAKTQNENVTTWYSYDELGRVMWVVQNIKSVGVKTLDYKYDFSGNVLEVAYQKGQADAFYHYYGYDAAQRLTTVYTSADGAKQTLQAEYSYYLHGPLKRVQVAGDLQGVDYTYTLQGALKAINHVNQTLEPGHDSPARNGVQKDLFALTLDYFSGDYRSKAIDAPSLLAGGPTAPTRYDGTIQGAAWRTAGSTDLHRVAYTYDEKSQLQDSQYGQWQRPKNSSNYLLNSAFTSALREGGLSYDANGNIQSLQRADQQGKLTDNFSYVYKPNTNQLKEVHTGSQAGATVLDYDYDELGQMTRQRDEQGQRYFTYDVTGKTTGVYLDEGHTKPVVSFAYDDRGFRVSKTAYLGAVVTTTYYVRDVGGNVLAVYDKPATTGIVQRSEVPLYGASRLGTLTHLNDNSASGTDDYRYELNDHLGSARVVFHRPTTTTDVETMELSGVPSRATFLNDDRYRVPADNAPSGQYVARLTDAQAPGQELKRVLTVTRGDTITFSALAQWKQNAATGSGATPYVLVGAAAGVNALSQRGPEGQTVYGTHNSNWLSLLAAGLGFTLGQRTPATLGSTALEGWIKYRVLDAQGNPMLDAQSQEIKGVDYMLGTGKWEYLQTGVRVPQDGTLEVMAGTSGSGEAVYFDNLRVEQTGGLIVQEQHQYAYGSPLPGLSYTVGNMRYRYGYQGQYAEKDAETGFESFELRLYNSRIGRWMSYDPYGQFASPYVSVGNNPVSGVDPDGGWGGPGPIYTLGNIAKNTQALGVVVVRGGKAAMSTGLRLGLQVGSSILRVGDAYARYGGALYGSMFNGLLGGGPDATMNMLGYRRLGPSSRAEAAGQFVGNTAVTGWGLLNMAVGGTGMGGGGALSLSGVGATVGMPIAAAGAVDFAYGTTVTGAGYVGLINSGRAMLKMAAPADNVYDDDGGRNGTRKPGKEFKGGDKASRDGTSGIPKEVLREAHRLKQAAGLEREFTKKELNFLRNGGKPEELF
jgi:RHS repeat-associated protein